MKNHISNAFKCFFTFITVVTMSCMMPFTTAEAGSDADDIFYDDFTGSRLDTNKWLIAEKNWGGTVTENGETVDYNGGVVSENVAVRNGNLFLTGLGDLYEGEQKGMWYCCKNGCLLFQILILLTGKPLILFQTIDSMYLIYA